MCIPMNSANAASLGMGTTMFGAGVSAYGSYMQGDIESDRMEYNARIARENAALAELSAKDVDKRGRLDARLYRRRVKAFISEQRAAYGASGVDVNVGAPADVVLDTALAGEADAMTIRKNAALDAWGLRSEAAGLRSEAGMLEAGAHTTKSMAAFAAGTTLLTGAADVGLQYFQYKNIGAGGKKGGTWKKRKGTKTGGRFHFPGTRTRTSVKRTIIQ